MLEKDMFSEIDCFKCVFVYVVDVKFIVGFWKVVCFIKYIFFLFYIV